MADDASDQRASESREGRERKRAASGAESQPIERTDPGSLLATGAKVAAAGALIGGAVAAARAARPSGPDVAERSGATEGAVSREPPAGGQDKPRKERPTEAAKRPDGDYPDKVKQRRRERPRKDGSPRAKSREDRFETRSATSASGGSTGGNDHDAARARSGGESPALLARRASEQLAELTGRDADGVVGLERTDGGWQARVQIIEVPRIPSTTDVLASYDVELDEHGDVRSYRQTQRYVRSHADRSAEE